MQTKNLCVTFGHTSSFETINSAIRSKFYCKDPPTTTTDFLDNNGTSSQVPLFWRA